MERVFVDTSAWYALADAADRNHRAAERWIGANRLPLVTSNVVFGETVTLLLRRLGHDVACRVGEAIRATRTTTRVAVTGADEEAAWVVLKGARDKRWSYSDCTSLVVMKRLGLRAAFAFDQDFVQMGLRVVPGVG